MRPTLVAVLVAGALLTGCGLRDPYAPQLRGATHVASAARVLPRESQSTAGASGETTLIARYATAWSNWSAATLARERAELAVLATGQLAEELQREAAQAVKNRLQEVSGAYSRGRFIGLIHQVDGRVVVVTYEEAAPVGGQAQGAYQIFLARTENTAEGWRLAEWQPAVDG